MNKRNKSFRLIKKNNALYAFSNILFLGTLFLVDVFITRYTSLVSVGIWKQSILLVQFTALLLSFGTLEGFRYNIAKDPHLLKQYLGSVLFFVSIISCIIGIILLNKKNILFITAFLSIDHILEARLFIPLLYILLSINLLYQQICLLQNRTDTIFYSILIFCLVFPVILYLLFKINEVTFILKVFISFIIAFGIQALFYINSTRIMPVLIVKENFFLKQLKQIMKYGFPLFISTYIGILTLHIDKVIVNKLGGITAFAIYSVGALEIPFIALITKSFTNISYPTIVMLMNQNNVNGAKLIWIKDLVRVSYISYPLICLMILFSDSIITGIFGHAYKEAVPIFKAYCLILLWRNAIYATIISVKEKTLIITKYSFIALIVNAILSFILYNLLGLIGIIYSTFIAISVLNLLFMKHEMLILEFYNYFLKDKIIIFLLICIFICFFI